MPDHNYQLGGGGIITVQMPDGTYITLENCSVSLSIYEEQTEMRRLDGGPPIPVAVSTEYEIQAIGNRGKIHQGEGVDLPPLSGLRKIKFRKE